MNHHTVTSPYLEVKALSKLLISQSKFSGPRKSISRYQKFEAKGVKIQTRIGYVAILYSLTYIFRWLKNRVFPFQNNPKNLDLDP